MGKCILTNKKAGGYIGIGNLLLIFSTLVFYLIFSNHEDCFQISVAGMLVIAICCEVTCLLRMIGLLPIVTCMCLSAAEVLFVRSILSSLVNYFNGVTMFGGTNQYGQIFALAGMIAAALVIELITCFLPRTVEEI